MPEPNDRIDELQAQLNRLVRTQIDFQREVTRIREELEKLRTTGTTIPKGESFVPPSPENPIENVVKDYQPPTEVQHEEPPRDQTKHQSAAPTFGYTERQRSRVDQKVDAVKEAARSDLEKFIGENLLSKIGIVILIIGVAIGGKYAIDNGWISPLMRIVFGYFCGFALIGFAVRLKAKYLNFSAVLISGGMAIMYFITYFAYAYYDLMNQPTAFVLMLLFTVFTTAAALNYEKQVIAHVGLVGAYAVPFLLSTGSANYRSLFIYIAIINFGILAISLKKYWKPLFFTSFIFTWAIFSVWVLGKFEPEQHFVLALVFVVIYFLTFYCSFIGYKLLSNENLAAENVVLILANSTIFFALGCYILTRPDGHSEYLGLFAVINAGIHLAFAAVADRIQKVPSDIVYLCAALVLTFITIAIPLEFNGNIVTIFWSAEAFALFLIGRKKGIALFELASYPVIAFASLSLLVLWLQVYADHYVGFPGTAYPVILNPSFVAGLFYVFAMSGIVIIDRDGKESPINESLAMIIRYILCFAAVAALYNVFRMEIAHYFHNMAVISRVPGSEEYYRTFNDLETLNIIWQLNYTLVFLTLLSFIDIGRWRDIIISYATLGLLLFAVFVFATVGLFELGAIREIYAGSPYIHLSIRYLSLACLAAAVVAVYRYVFGDKIFPKGDSSAAFLFDSFFYGLLWIVASSELVNWLSIFGFQDSYKLGLSILWGIYALVLVSIGIYQAKKYLRIGAIGLFAITLIKVFFYDIAYMDTISKTVVFVSLGVLILVVAFLYNKYTSLIFSAKEDGSK